MSDQGAAVTADDREQMTRALSRQIRERTPADQRQARALAEHLIELGWTLPSEPLGYVVGWQHEGRTLLAFDELEVGILGDRARAYTELGEASQFLAEVAPEDPRTRFCVYELREATP
ncbi:hypothetical protein [Nocardia abscessus]|uniref:hypothetical protein n=1 Tax=Nocardia abscessus TaxID=120957 RepID=UPI002453906C|nr:hypothetical protein [Nocardia abscessus]